MRRTLILIPALTLALIGGAAATAPGTKPAKVPRKTGKPTGTARPKPTAAPRKPMAFSPEELDLAPGEHYPAELFVPSPTGKAFKGALTYAPSTGVTVKPDPRWNGSLPPWGVKTYPTITAAADAQGKIPVEAALANGGKATLTVNIVALPVDVIPGRAELKVRITNPFRGRLLTGRVQVSNPDRFLENVTALEFKAEPGQCGEIVFPLPGASPADGVAYSFTFTIETYQGYHSVKTLPLTFPAQQEKTPAGVGGK